MARRVAWFSCGAASAVAAVASAEGAGIAAGAGFVQFGDGRLWFALAPVPEPASLFLIVLTGCIMSLRRTRHASLPTTSK